MGELKQKALRGVLWSIIDKGCVKFMSFAIGIIIARILTPADFGIVGMIMVFIVIANIMIDSGISQALIQRKEKYDSDYSTAFFFNLFVSSLCYLVLYLIAPSIANFYSMPILIHVLRVLGINIIIIALATVQRANLQKALDFRTIAIVNITGVILSGAIGIYLAYSDWGVWAIVSQQIAFHTTTTTAYWIFGKWHPRMDFSRSSLAHLWHFGSKLLTAGLVATVLREVYTVTIGKFYRAAELGFYSRAVQTTDMVSQTANEMINAVTFPILSSLQDDEDKMLSVYSRMLGMTAFCIFPLMILLAVIAKPLTQVLLTDKWLPMVPLLQWLCFARMFTPISSINMNILNAVGRSDLYMKVDLSKLPLTILTMIITIPLGVKAIVIGNLIFTIICYFINAYLPGRMFGFGVVPQFHVFWRIFISSVIMGIITSVLISQIYNPILQLILGVFVGITAYIVCSKVFKVKEIEEVLIICRNYIGNCKN